MGPGGIAVFDPHHQLIVVDWGGEMLERFDLDTGTAGDVIGLGYSQPAYPATTIEQGEAFFYSAAWSNNGRKSCASCHFDELDTDGLGFSNGTVAPTALHQVKPSHNLATTGGYYWNGSFVEADYASLEFAALTRTNCEVVELGLVEGPGSDPATRVGDPNNLYTTGHDADCRPVSSGPGVLANQGTIDPVIAAEKLVRDQRILGTTGLDSMTLSRAIDFFVVSELRLPPNPLAQEYGAGRLDGGERAQLERGRMLFDSAGCAFCPEPGRASPHTPAHGSGADWLKQFIDAYGNDPRILGPLGALPQPMLDAIGNERRDREPGVYVDAIDAFVPFCFELSNCLAFKDPLTAPDKAEESRRLDLLVRINLADPDRGFVPGNVRGAPQLDTPSLRGVWTQPRLMHNGLARSVGEAILAPGHPGLLPGETGLAVDAKGAFDVHGSTSKLSAPDARALVRYVESIE
jgi:hypothetical protein